MGSVLGFESMGSQIMNLFKPQEEKKKINILMIGLDSAGKTSILYKMKLDELVVTIPTIGFNVEVCDVKNVKITCWDMGGEDRIYSLWRHYYKDKDCVVFVIDGTDYERLSEAWDEFKRMYKDENINGLPCLILMNKMDNKRDIKGMRKHFSSVQFIERFRLYEFLRTNNWFICDTSSHTGEGLLEGFRLLCTALEGNPEKMWYHCEEYYKIKKIYSIGWRPSLHLLYPKKYRMYVWSLLLINDRLELPMDVVKVILKYIPVLEVETFEQMRSLSELYLKNSERYECMEIVKEVLYK